MAKVEKRILFSATQRSENHAVTRKEKWKGVKPTSTRNRGKENQKKNASRGGGSGGGYGVTSYRQTPQKKTSLQKHEDRDERSLKGKRGCLALERQGCDFGGGRGC